MTPASPDMPPARPVPPHTATPRWPSHFAFFAGGIAWSIHLLGSYLIAEFGCLSGSGQNQHLGITTLAWSLAALSTSTLLLAIAAAIVGHLAWRHLQQRGSASAETADTTIYFARSGTIMSALFALVIVCQSIPIFYYLQGC